MTPIITNPGDYRTADGMRATLEAQIAAADRLVDAAERLASRCTEDDLVAAAFLRHLRNMAAAYRAAKEE